MKKVLFLAAALFAATAGAQTYYITPDGRVVQMGQSPQYRPPPQYYAPQYIQPYAGATQMYPPQIQRYYYPPPQYYYQPQPQYRFRR